MQYAAELHSTQELGALVDAAQREPVFIGRERRDVAVLVSAAEYDLLRTCANEDFQAFCDQVSDQAVQKGLTEESLSELLDRA